MRSLNWQRFYWLNVQRMAELMLKPRQHLVRTKYFTAIVRQPLDKKKRQSTFLEALGTLNDFEIHYGHYLFSVHICRKCRHKYSVPSEKMTDVNIATELLTDAFLDEFDTALLFTGDGDLVAPIKAVKRLFPQKRVVVAFPPNRNSAALKRVATAYTRVGRSVLAKSQFPKWLTKPDGYTLRRPAEWK